MYNNARNYQPNRHQTPIERGSLSPQNSMLIQKNAASEQQCTFAGHTDNRVPRGESPAMPQLLPGLHYDVVPNRENGPSAAELKLEALTRKLETEMNFTGSTGAQRSPRTLSNELPHVFVNTSHTKRPSPLGSPSSSSSFFQPSSNFQLGKSTSGNVMTQRTAPAQALDRYTTQALTAGRYIPQQQPPPPSTTSSITVKQNNDRSSRLDESHAAGLLTMAVQQNTKHLDQQTIQYGGLVGKRELDTEPSRFGRCHSCGEKIVEASDACQAMGHLYHVYCFICSSCGRTLRGKAFYNIHGKIYCEEDYLYSGFQQTAERCAVCGHLITEQILQATGRSYHPGCFRCCKCDECLDGLSFTVDVDNNVYCVADYHRLYAPRCAACDEAIIPVEGTEETVRVVAMDKDFHVDCYHCQMCGMQLTDEPDQRCYPLDGQLLCLNCHLQQINSYQSLH